MRGLCWVTTAALLSSFVLAVDRSNFKTCDQSSFCRRQRATPEGRNVYVVVISSLRVEPTTLSMQLLNLDTKERLKLELSGLRGNMVRLKINEVNPLSSRYEPPVGDVLVKEPEKDNLRMLLSSSSSVSVALGDTTVVVSANPFRIDFIMDKEPVMSVNAKGLLNFEHLREKSQGTGKEEEPDIEEPPVGGEEADKEEADKEEADKEEEHENNEQKEGEKTEEEKAADEKERDKWEETFKTHTDSKPKGPSSVGLDVSFPGFEHVYGLPEHADSLLLKSTKGTEPYRLYNLDVFEYELYSPMALYGSVPMLVAHSEKRTLGMFWMNVAESWIDIRSVIADKTMFSKLVDFVKGDSDIPQIDSHWFSESGIIDVIFMLGPTPNDVFQQYAKLTGTTALPPLFAIAYHQSRWNYNDEEDVASVVAGYDEHDIPLDVLWLDIEHTDGKRYFTWDAHKFPNSVDMINKVAAKGRKMVTIIDPHIKKDDNYFVHKEATEKGYYVKNKDGTDYEGWCWPGSSGWLDFLNPEVRQFWANKLQPNEYVGSTLDLYTWNDMNEPSVFNGPEITMHKDAIHFGGWEHRDVHNMYGTYLHRSTFEGQLQRSNNQKRPFVLSRAFFAGSQRYGAVWTGDNTGEWNHLKISLPMLMTLNLVGITLSGADVGGFFKNPDSELLTRWYQAAAYQPFFRAHAHLDTRRREPWLLPSEHLHAIREAVRTRYSLLPFWYTLFYNAETTGSPIMKPLWVDFPTDKGTFAMEDEHLVGSALLVHPVTDAGAAGVNVYLPGTDQVWYSVDTYEKFAGGRQHYITVNLEKIPVFQRGGFIIPRKMRIRRAAILARNDPYTLVVTLDRKGSARGDLYIDDYQSYDYRQGSFIHREFTLEDKKLTSKSLNPSNSGFVTKSWLERVIVAGVTTKPMTVKLTGNSVQPQQLDFTFDPSKQLLTIRKPGINIAEDFVISLE